MKRFCFALDLINEPQLIAEYRQYHQNVWPEIMDSIESAGILDLEIYLTGNRLFMIMETDDEFSLAEKSKTDTKNPKVQEWEKLMWQYQQALPQAQPGEKWRLMDLIFSLRSNSDI